MYDQSVFLFRRDLRLRDNSGLIAAMQASKSVIPVFVVDPVLVEKWSGATKRMTFLAHALEQLDEEIASYGGRLLILGGDPVGALEKLLSQHSVDAVFSNRDYTPWARGRDNKLKAVCDRAGVRFESYADQLLNEPESVSKADGKPYTVFTPYYKRAKVHAVSRPELHAAFKFSTSSGDSLQGSFLGHYLSDSFKKGSLSVTDALGRIETLSEYEQTKDLPGTAGTSRMSAMLRFGLCSVREVYQTVKASHGHEHALIRQLYWRDFYFQIGFHFPRVYRSAFREKYNQLVWDHNPEGLRAWQEGRTGFPLIDAGMRELLATGYMHNRVRMVVASFLTKNLHIDWREGEAHFAKHLIDFDPALNNGNWQWSASTGCDAQPYFRVFSPWRQQARFDKDCSYIKQWLPELRELSAKEIHGLEKSDDKYLPQIVNLKASAEESKHRFRSLAG
jgi:deoxyribodipyrimidine photo-lyase